MLHLPQPSPVYVRILFAVLLLSAAVGATGRLPRLAGWVCAFTMLDWLSNGMSYSKVDHDHVALVVALFVLPTVGAARTRDQTPDGRLGGADDSVRRRGVLLPGRVGEGAAERVGLGRRHFLPLVVCLLAFVPLERLGEPGFRTRWARRRRAAGGRPREASATPSSAR